MIKEAENSMQWRAREKEREKRMSGNVDERLRSPVDEGRQIRSQHYG